MALASREREREVKSISRGTLANVTHVIVPPWKSSLPLAVDPDPCSGYQPNSLPTAAGEGWSLGRRGDGWRPLIEKMEPFHSGQNSHNLRERRKAV